MTSIRQSTERWRRRFSWIDEWKEIADLSGRPLGVELIVPDWFYAGVINEALVLTIDRAYFGLTGGLERLYRLVRKHAGNQSGGWRFDFMHLHAKSGALSPLKHFAFDLRDIVRRQPIPNYRLDIRRGPFDRELLVSRHGCARLSAPARRLRPAAIDATGEGEDFYTLMAKLKERLFGP